MSFFSVLGYLVYLGYLGYLVYLGYLGYLVYLGYLGLVGYLGYFSVLVTSLLPDWFLQIPDGERGSVSAERSRLFFDNSITLRG